MRSLLVWLPVASIWTAGSTPGVAAESTLPGPPRSVLAAHAAGPYIDVRPPWAFAGEEALLTIDVASNASDLRGVLWRSGSCVFGSYGTTPAVWVNGTRVQCRTPAHAKVGVAHLRVTAAGLEPPSAPTPFTFHPHFAITAQPRILVMGRSHTLSLQLAGNAPGSVGAADCVFLPRRAFGVSTAAHMDMGSSHVRALLRVPARRVLTKESEVECQHVSLPRGSFWLVLTAQGGEPLVRPHTAAASIEVVGDIRIDAVSPSVLLAHVSNMTIEVNVSGPTRLTDIADHGEALLCAFGEEEAKMPAGVSVATVLEPHRARCTTPAALWQRRRGNAMSATVSLSLHAGSSGSLSQAVLLPLLPPLTAASVWPNISTARDLESLVVTFEGPPAWLFAGSRLRCTVGESVSGPGTWLGNGRVRCAPLYVDEGRLTPRTHSVLVGAEDGSWSLRMGEVVLLPPLLHHSIDGPILQQEVVVKPHTRDDNPHLVGLAACSPTEVRINGVFPSPCPECRCRFNDVDLGPPLLLEPSAAICKLPPGDFGGSGTVVSHLGISLHASSSFSLPGHSVPLVLMPAADVGVPRPLMLATEEGTPRCTKAGGPVECQASSPHQAWLQTSVPAAVDVQCLWYAAWDSDIKTAAISSRTPAKLLDGGAAAFCEASEYVRGRGGIVAVGLEVDGVPSAAAVPAWLRSASRTEVFPGQGRAGHPSMLQVFGQSVADATLDPMSRMPRCRFLSESDDGSYDEVEAIVPLPAGGPSIFCPSQSASSTSHHGLVPVRVVMSYEEQLWGSEALRYQNAAQRSRSIRLSWLPSEGRTAMQFHLSLDEVARLTPFAACLFLCSGRRTPAVRGSQGGVDVHCPLPPLPLQGPCDVELLLDGMLSSSGQTKTVLAVHRTPELVSLTPASVARVGGDRLLWKLRGLPEGARLYDAGSCVCRFFGQGGEGSPEAWAQPVTRHSPLDVPCSADDGGPKHSVSCLVPDLSTFGAGLSRVPVQLHTSDGAVQVPEAPVALYLHDRPIFHEVTPTALYTGLPQHLTIRGRAFPAQVAMFAAWRGFPETRGPCQWISPEFMACRLLPSNRSGALVLEVDAGEHSRQPFEVAALDLQPPPLVVEPSGAQLSATSRWARLGLLDPLGLQARLESVSLHKLQCKMGALVLPTRVLREPARLECLAPEGLTGSVAQFTVAFGSGNLQVHGRGGVSVRVGVEVPQAPAVISSLPAAGQSSLSLLPASEPILEDFFPRVGVAGTLVEVLIEGQHFPDAEVPGNLSSIQCVLGGDGRRSRAVRLSDRLLRCNVSRDYAGETKLGLAFAGLAKTMRFSRTFMWGAAADGAEDVVGLIAGSAGGAVIEFGPTSWRQYEDPPARLLCDVLTEDQALVQRTLAQVEGGKASCKIGQVPEELTPLSAKVYLNLDGWGFVAKPRRLTILQAPKVAAVSPTALFNGYGSTLTLSGESFVGGITCFFSNGASSEVIVFNSTAAICSAPTTSNTTGLGVQVGFHRVQNPHSAAHLRYVEVPSALMLWPRGGFSSTAQTVIISGSGFDREICYVANIGTALSTRCTALTDRALRCRIPNFSALGLAVKVGDVVTFSIEVAPVGADGFWSTGLNYSVAHGPTGALEVASVPSQGSVALVVPGVAFTETLRCVFRAGESVVIEPVNVDASNDSGVVCDSPPGLPAVGTPSFQLLDTSKEEEGRAAITPETPLDWTEPLGVLALELQPAAVPLLQSEGGATFRVRFFSGVRGPIACRLWPSENVTQATEENATSVECRANVGAVGTYTLQLARVAEHSFQWEATNLRLDVYHQPEVLGIWPSQVYLGQDWIIQVSMTELPNRRLTERALACFVGSRRSSGEALTGSSAECHLARSEVEALGPGDHIVEVAANGVHLTKSAQPVMLRVLGEGPEITGLSSNGFAVARGSRLVLRGQRLPPEAECVFGEGAAGAARAAADVYNSTALSCLVPQSAPLGMEVLLHLASAGQILQAHVVTARNQGTPLSLAIVKQPQQHRRAAESGTAQSGVPAKFRLGVSHAGMGEGPYDMGGECAAGPPDSTFDELAQVTQVPPSCPGCGVECAVPYLRKEVELRFRLHGTAGWPGGAQRLPVTPPVVPTGMMPTDVLPDGAALRFQGEGLLEFLQLHRKRLVCRIGKIEAAATLARDASWPALCHLPSLREVEGLDVRVQLAVRGVGGDLEPLGPFFQLRVRLQPRVLSIFPDAGAVGVALPLMLHVVNFPENAAAICDFGHLGKVQAQATMDEESRGAALHCLTPVPQLVARVPLRLRLMLTLAEPTVLQQLELTLGDYEFARPPAGPAIAAVPPFSHPLGSNGTLEWRSTIPVFQGMAQVLYRCIWDTAQPGNVSTHVLALSVYGALCQIPVASSPLATAVRLQDPLGRTVAQLPSFRFFKLMNGSWLPLPNSSLTAGSVVRFESGENLYQEERFGPLESLPALDCLLSQNTAFREIITPLVVDAGGLECVLPDVREGPYTLSLLEGGHHESNGMEVFVIGDSGAIERTTVDVAGDDDDKVTDIESESWPQQEPDERGPLIVARSQVFNETVAAQGSENRWRAQRARISLDGQRLLFSAQPPPGKAAVCVVGPFIFRQRPPLRPVDGGWPFACDVSGSGFDARAWSELPELSLVEASLESQATAIELAAASWMEIAIHSMSPVQGSILGGTTLRLAALAPENWMPHRYWCVFGKDHTVPAQVVTDGTPSQRLLWRVITLHSFSQGQAIYMTEKSVSGVAAEPEEMQFFVVDGEEGGSFALYNVLHQRFMQMVGGKLVPGPRMDVSPGVRIQSLNPNLTLGEEDVASMRFELQDMGNGEVALRGRASGLFVHMTKHLTLEGVESLQLGHSMRFAVVVAEPAADAPWVDLECRSPPYSVPGRVPVWISTAPEIAPGQEPPIYAPLYEYVPALGLAMASPAAVPHYFTRPQNVTVKIKTLEKQRHSSASTDPGADGASHLEVEPLLQDLVAGASVMFKHKGAEVALCANSSHVSTCSSAGVFRIESTESGGMALRGSADGFYLQADGDSLTTGSAAGRTEFDLVDLGGGEVAIYSPGTQQYVQLNTTSGAVSLTPASHGTRLEMLLVEQTHLWLKWRTTRAIERTDVAPVAEAPARVEQLGPAVRGRVHCRAQGQTSPARRIATLDGDFAVACLLPEQLLLSEEVVDAAADPVASPELVAKELYERNGTAVPIRFIGRPTPNKTEPIPYVPVIAPPTQKWYDAGARLEVSLNGPDGDFISVPSTAVKALPFRPPHEVTPLQGWASGGTLLTLRGVLWLEDDQMELVLVFLFEDASTKAPCARVNRNTATCLSPPSAWLQPGNSSLSLELHFYGAVHTMDLPGVEYEYVAIPQVAGSTPGAAPRSGGSKILVNGGPFDSRVPYWCVWMPTAEHAVVRGTLVALNPGQVVGETSLLCETPVVLAPVRTSLTLALDPELSAIAFGETTFDFYQDLRLRGVKHPSCILGQEGTLYLEGVFPSEEPLQCVFLSTRAHEQSAPWHVSTAQTRLRLLDAGHAECSCPVLHNVAGSVSFLRIAAAELVSEEALAIRFERAPLSLQAWDAPSPYRPLVEQSPASLFQVMQHNLSEGGGGLLPIFSADHEVRLHEGATCAIGNQLGQVVASPPSVHQQQPGLLLGGNESSYSCLLPGLPPAASNGAPRQEEVFVSPDGIRWFAAGHVLVVPPPTLHSLHLSSHHMGSHATIRVTGTGFVPGCQCAFVDGLSWEPGAALLQLQHQALAEYSDVLASEELLCSVPRKLAEAKFRVAVVAVCPPVGVSSNMLWWHSFVAPAFERILSHTVGRGAAGQELLLQGRGFLAASPLACVASDQPEKQHPVKVLTDELATCTLPLGPARGLGRSWVHPAPLLLSLITTSGHATPSLPLPIAEPVDVLSMSPDPGLAYPEGGNYVEVIGRNLPIGTLWCRFGDQYVIAEVDPYSRQTLASCEVPPGFPHRTTMQAIAMAHGVASPVYNFTYRAGSRILRVSPRAYIPFRYTTERQQRLELHGEGFTLGAPCSVRFGPTTAPGTIVKSDALIEALVPAMESNDTVPLHVFCDGLQATPKLTLQFHFTDLPVVSSIEPSAVEAQGGGWVTLHGQNFADLHGRACIFGNVVVGEADVQPLGSFMVRCRVPALPQDASEVLVSYASDGIHFSLEHTVLTLPARMRILGITPEAAFVAIQTPVTVVGHHFTDDVECLFNDHVRVRPYVVQPQRLVCDLPGDFRQVGMRVSVSVVLPEDSGRVRNYLLHEGPFYIQIRERPHFKNVFPLLETIEGGTPLMLSTGLDFDSVAMCVDDVGDRNFTGLQFRFEEVPQILRLHPKLAWRGKTVSVFGLHFSVELTMHCRFSATEEGEDDVQVTALVHSAEELTCLIPPSLPLPSAAGVVGKEVGLRVTRNQFEWSNSESLQVFGAEAVHVVPEPRHVPGFGQEVVRMSIPAPAVMPGYGGGPCQDDESRTCLGFHGAAPATCEEYAAAGLCGSLQYDRCCPRTCGQCSEQLLAASPDNLACLLDGVLLRPYTALPIESGMFAWECSLPPLAEGPHELNLVLFSAGYSNPYPEHGPVLDEAAAQPVAMATIHSWGGERSADPFRRRASPHFVHAAGGARATLQGVTASMLQRCRVGDEGLELRSRDMADGACASETWCASEVTYSPPYCCGPTLTETYAPIVLDNSTVECELPALPLFQDGQFGRSTDGSPNMHASQQLFLGRNEGNDTTTWSAMEVNVSYERPLATEMHTIMPQRGPLLGQDVVLIRNGGDDARSDPRTLARTRCLCRFGAIKVHAVCVTASMTIQCRAPATVRVGSVPVSFSVNGGVEWSSPGLTFEYYSPPLFTAVHPPIGILSRSQNVTIYGEKFPTSDIPIFCRWQGSIIVPAHVNSSTDLVCLMPDKSSFVPFEEPFTPMPITLEMSFSGYPSIWVPVDSRLTFTHHEVPVRGLQHIFINPRHGLELGGALLNITGDHFVYPTREEVHAYCVFGGHYKTFATVLSSTRIQCHAPPLQDVLVSPQLPAVVTVDLSFDSGNTTTQLMSTYTYLQSFDFERMEPSQGLYERSTDVVLYGQNFKKTPLVSCRFGNISMPAEVSDASKLKCTAPAQASPGVYPVSFTVEGQIFLDTGLTWTARDEPIIEALIPSRGVRTGGTEVVVKITNVEFGGGGFQCKFGFQLVHVQTNAEGDLYCQAPSCEYAMYKDYKATIDTFDSAEEECSGFVPVQLTFNGVDFFGSLTYEYVITPQVTQIVPFPASGWSSNLTIVVEGAHFDPPMYCKLAGYESVEATDVQQESMKCVVPSIPEADRPDVLTGIHELMLYLEVSPNEQDWTRYRTAFMVYREPEVTHVEPNSTFREHAVQGVFVIQGRYFRLLQSNITACVWLFNAYESPERVQAELLAPDVLRCQPLMPLAAQSTVPELLQPDYAEIRVSMSTLVDSPSAGHIYLEDRMQLAPRDGVYPVECMFTGGCNVTLQGEHLWDEPDLFVAVGDTVLEAIRGFGDTAIIRIPPVSHMAAVPRSEGLWLSRNLRDRTPVEFSIDYYPIEPGFYYRPELHQGQPQPCPQGHYCPGVEAEPLTWVLTGDVPAPCLPGTWQNATGKDFCVSCPEGVQCSRPAMIEPEHCEPGYICWGMTEVDANQAMCPAGYLCIRPPNGKTALTTSRRLQSRTGAAAAAGEFESVAANGSAGGSSTVAAWESESGTPKRRLRLAELPSNVELELCPAGTICPAGSIAQGSADGTWALAGGAVQCVRKGVVCSSGTSTPYSNDTVAAPGYYVLEDLSDVVECPTGAHCPGGADAAEPLECPPGQYQGVEGQSACSSCTAGTMCSSFGSTSPEICPAGQVCSHPGRMTPTYLCPSGSFCVTGTVTLNALSGLDWGVPAVCSAGTYCNLGTTTNDTSGDCTEATCPVACTAGTFCQANTTSAGGTDNCPPRWYCPPGSDVPLAAPPGHYVPESGAIYPSKCRPGTYAPEWLMQECLECPAGTECPLDGTVFPTDCAPGSYRELTSQGEDASDNVMCILCPQGTWSPYGALKSVLECHTCDERYVCPIEGTTIFATIDQPCPAGALATEICYENSQGSDCPQGFGCNSGTTSFTQYDYPCEPGFWCKLRTLPREARNLLCPAGYYCKIETGESGSSGRFAFPCPANYFCPEGTAAVDQREDDKLVVLLSNVQASREIVTQSNNETGAMCRRCNDTMPPGEFDLSACIPCGKLYEEEESTRRLRIRGPSFSGSGTRNETSEGVLVAAPWLGQASKVGLGRRLTVELNPQVCAPNITMLDPLPWEEDDACYMAREEEWGNLACPRGTNSNIGSESPEDCIQQGELIAVMNIYQCYPHSSRPADSCATDGYRDIVALGESYFCDESEVLCGVYEAIEIFKSSTSYKTSYIFGSLLDPDDPAAVETVDFLAYDPQEDASLHEERPFHRIHLEPMEIAILDFDFTSLKPGTLLNAEGFGHFDINIYSDFVPEENLAQDQGHTLPMFFQRRENADLRIRFILKILALQAFNFSVSLDLRHGGFLTSLSSVRESLNVRKYHPTRSWWGRRDFFVAIINSELLAGRNIELPYNMIPGMARMPGEANLVIDAIDTADMWNAPQTTLEDGDLSLDNQMNSGSAFWSSEGVETVALPWLPFFSSCEGFDSHIVLWDLLENPGREVYGTREGCTYYDKDEVVIVPPIPINLATMKVIVEPTADNCEIVVNCAFEESMTFGDFSSEIWWEVNEEELDLFYLTKEPVDYETFAMQDDYFADQQGTDSLIKVWFSAEGRASGMRFPRQVAFEIGYYQETQEKKLVVTAEMGLEEFDDDTTTETYELTLTFGALGWMELMNSFQLPYHVYGLLYCIIGATSVTTTIAFWAVFRLTTRKAQVPDFRFLECYQLMLGWPLQGVMAASVPVLVLCGIIKAMFLESTDMLKNIPCTFEGIGLTLEDESETERCKAGRTGVCFFFGGVLILVSGSKLIVPRLREVEEQFLLQQPTQMLDREGLPLFPGQKSSIRSVPIRWKRGHFIFVSILLVLPLVVMWEFTYANFFEAQAVWFILGFNFAMMPIEGALSKAAREELLEVPLSTACSVVLFIGTLGAEDFADFCEGFFIELLVGIVDRLVLVFIFKWSEDLVRGVTRWTRTRYWFWTGILSLTKGRGAQGLKLSQVELPDTREQDDEEEQEGTPIEEAMEEIIGAGTTCMSTILTPVLIVVIIMFAKETQMPEMYGIREVDMRCYLLFGLVIAPFQVLMDILMNHATEVAHGVKIYDYMLYAKWRWQNRLTRWLYDDPRMDESIAEPLQSVNHLCFSPQFYFIEAYYSWGLLMLLLSFTTLLRNEMNPFNDPALPLIVFQQLVCNRILDRIITIMITSILWKPKGNSLYQTFNRSVAITLKRKDIKMAAERYRLWFLHRHANWLVEQMGTLFTPRARDRYRSRLSQLYQQALKLQPQHVYKAPGPAFPKPTAHMELPANLRAELEEDSNSDEAEPPWVTPNAVTALPAPSPSALQRPGGLLPNTLVPAFPAPGQPPPMSPGGYGQLQAMPALPMVPPSPQLPAPPPELELAPDAWPLRVFAAEEGEENSRVGGFGPLAALAGLAWFRTARRRLFMQKLAEEERVSLRPDTRCGVCGVTEQDPFVLERIGVWESGAQLRVRIVEDMDELIRGFELHYGVPPLPVQEEQWRSWMNRHEAFLTVCVRCSGNKALPIMGGADDTQAPSNPKSLAREDSSASGLGALTNTARRHSGASVATGYTEHWSDSAGASRRQSQDLEGPFGQGFDSTDESDEETGRKDHDDHDHEKAQVFADNAGEVSLAAREMLIFWWRQGRKHLKAQRKREGGGR